MNKQTYSSAAKWRFSPLAVLERLAAIPLLVSVLLALFSGTVRAGRAYRLRSSSGSLVYAFLAFAAFTVPGASAMAISTGCVQFATSPTYYNTNVFSALQFDAGEVISFNVTSTWGITATVTDLNGGGPVTLGSVSGINAFETKLA